MRYIPTIVSGCILVAACASTIKESMTKLEGQPVSVLINKIGLPIEERRIAGMKVYIWGSPGKLVKGERGKCQIRAVMSDNVIEALEYEGDESLCQRYAGRLRL
jgi:cobalamin biosynthesis protein CbiD